MAGAEHPLTGAELDELQRAVRSRLAGAAEAPPPGALARILDLPVTVRVELGSQACSVSDVVALASGKVLELEHSADQPLAVCIGDRLIARGRAVVVGGKFAVEILALAPLEQPAAVTSRRVRHNGGGVTRVVPEGLVTG